MDIDTLEAGPALDALVAEKVMGWTKYVFEKEGSVHTEWIESGPDGKRTHSCFFPSNDIATAWEVFRKAFRSDNDNGVFVGHVVSGWQVIELVGHSPNYLAGADTAQLAICRAALADVDHTLVIR